MALPLTAVLRWTARVVGILILLLIAILAIDSPSPPVLKIAI
jgi:uncharacterized integral membrane protein